MAEELNAQVRITAAVEGLKAGMAEAQTSFTSATNSMKAAAESTMAVFTRFNVILMGITTILAGGAAFKDSVNEVKNLTGESMKLSMALGEAVGEVSDLVTALGDAYITADEFSSANQKLTAHIRQNEGAVNDMGVATRDANGDLLNQRTIFMNAVEALRGYKEGTDRNAAAQELFGRSGQEALKFLKLNSQMLDDAKKKNEELNLQITDKNVKSTKEYKAAMNDFGDTISAIKKAIGEALMPVLTKLANWFSEIGPKAVNIARQAMAVFVFILDVLKIAAYAVMYGFEQLIDWIVLFAQVAWDALHFNFGDAKNHWKAGLDAIHTETKQHGDALINMSKKMIEDYNANMSKGVKSSLIVGKGEGSKGFVKPEESKETKDESSTLMRELQMQLEKQKEALGAFHEYTKAEELAFWNSKLGIAQAGGEKYKNATLEIQKKISELTLASQREVVKKQVDDLKFQADLDRTNLETKKDAYEKIFNLIASKYDKDSTEYRQALLNKLAAEKEYKDKSIEIETQKLQQTQSLQLEGLQQESNLYEMYSQQGLISEQEKLQILRGLEVQRYQIRLETLNKEAELNKNNIEKYREYLLQIELLQKQHETKMKESSNQLAINSFAPFKTMGDNLANSLEDALLKMTQGTLKFSTFVRGIIPAIGQEFTKMAIKMATDWIKEHVIMEAMSKLFGAKEVATKAVTEGAKTTIQAGASATRSAMSAGESIKEILNSAWTAAANVYKSIAAIPFVGPFLAPAMAIGAVAAVVGFARNIASASRGYDIPSGVNPMTQLHQEEMVLPASIANPLRENLAGGGGMGGGTNITINAVDAKGVKDLFMSHGGALVDALKKQNRAFAR